MTDQFIDEQPISCADKECEAIEDQGSYQSETKSALLISLNIFMFMTEELATVSISCTPIRSKPRLSFPLLDLKKMDPEEKEMLHQRLFAESEDMTYKFQQLFNKTRKSLVVRRISVDNLLKYLDCLGSMEPTFQGSDLPVLGCQLPELRKTESVDKAMSVISSYCSFFNYRIVEEIINNLGTERDKTNLKNYQEEFSVYAQRHIFECPSELGLHVSVKCPYHHCLRQRRSM